MPRVVLDLSADELGLVLTFLPDAEAIARAATGKFARAGDRTERIRANSPESNSRGEFALIGGGGGRITIKGKSRDTTSLPEALTQSVKASAARCCDSMESISTHEPNGIWSGAPLRNPGGSPWGGAP